MSTQAIVNLIFETLWWVILGRVLMSWFDPSGNYRISRILYDMSEPILAPARRILPTFGGAEPSRISARGRLAQLVRAHGSHP
ncbi:MAG: YggT family protein [bacterium]|nr:YggT family protein [Candidatus Aquidulcis sp.]